MPTVYCSVNCYQPKYQTAATFRLQNITQLWHNTIGHNQHFQPLRTIINAPSFRVTFFHVAFNVCVDSLYRFLDPFFKLRAMDGWKIEQNNSERRCKEKKGGGKERNDDGRLMATSFQGTDRKKRVKKSDASRYGCCYDPVSSFPFVVEAWPVVKIPSLAVGVADWNGIRYSPHASATERFADERILIVLLTLYRVSVANVQRFPRVNFSTELSINRYYLFTNSISIYSIIQLQIHAYSRFVENVYENNT